MTKQILAFLFCFKRELNLYSPLTLTFTLRARTQTFTPPLQWGSGVAGVAGVAGVVGVAGVAGRVCAAPARSAEVVAENCSADACAGTLCSSIYV